MRRFRTFFKYFTKNKKAFLKYSGLSFIAGILELFGVALTYPFIIKLLAKEPQAGFFNSPLIIGLSIITLFLVKNALMIFSGEFKSFSCSKRKHSRLFNP